MKTYQVLKKAVITEKSLAASARGKYTFLVDPRAKKPEIARAVEQAFGVHVVSLATMKLKGKTRRFGSRRKQVTTSTIKKAVVQLLPEEKIEVFTTQETEKPKKGK